MYRLAAIAALVSRAYAQEAQSPQDLLKTAIALHQAGKLDEAIADYRLLLSKYPDMAQIRSNLGAALVGQGKYAEAIVEYRHALTNHPDTQVQLNLALAYYKAGEYSLASQNLEKVCKAAPRNTQALLLLSDCYLRAGKNKKLIELLTPIRPDDPNAIAAINYLLGTALVRDGQTAQGQVVIDRILKKGDSAEAHLLIGTTKFFVNDFAGALADLQRAVELNPNLPDVQAYYGLALLSTGDQAGARKAFDIELAQDPNNFEANLRMGVILRQDEENEQAMKYFRHALQVRPGDLGVRYQIASVDLALGQVEGARQELESVLKEAPAFVEAHVSLATVYYRQKRKIDGDRERAIVAKLNAAQQANQPAAKAQQ